MKYELVKFKNGKWGVKDSEGFCCFGVFGINSGDYSWTTPRNIVYWAQSRFRWRAVRLLNKMNKSITLTDQVEYDSIKETP